MNAMTKVAQRLRWLAIACFVLIATCSHAVEDVPVPKLTVPPLDAQHRELASVLKSIAKPDGVDYATLMADLTALQRYQAQVAAVAMPTERLEILSLFINSYNAHTLALVAANLPEDASTWKDWSIRSIGSWLSGPWKSYRFRVAGSPYTLDEMEHAVLRPLGEPRIHFAVNCASRSCPTLPPAPFLAASMEEQLEAATRTFVHAHDHLRLEQGDVLTNPILDWFAADFTGANELRTFLGKRATAPLAQALTDGARIRFFAYDWRLNLTTTP